MNNSISIKFNLFNFTADPGGKGPHFLFDIGQNHFPLDRTVIPQSRCSVEMLVDTSLSQL